MIFTYLSNIDIVTLTIIKYDVITIYSTIYLNTWTAVLTMLFRFSCTLTMVYIYRNASSPCSPIAHTYDAMGLWCCRTVELYCAMAPHPSSPLADLMARSVLFVVIYFRACREAGWGERGRCPLASSAYTVPDTKPAICT